VNGEWGKFKKFNWKGRTGLNKTFVNLNSLTLVRYKEQGLTNFGFGY